MEENFFNMDGIVSGADITANDIFGTDDTTETLEPAKEPEKNEEIEQETTEITNASADDVFGEEESESVSSKSTGGKEDTENTEESDSPDNPNFYSSITDALVDDGVFPDLTPDDIKKIQSPEDFRELIQSQIRAGFDERTKRINDALNYNVEPSAVRNYESTLNFLEQVTPEILLEEGDRGDDIRRKLIQLAFLNRGYSSERAENMTEKLFANGDDIEEAKLALEENKKYFSEKYRNIIEEARVKTEQEKKEKLKQVEALKNDIMSNGKVFEDIEIDKVTRQKVVDNILKPVYKDPDTGEYLTAILKYELENRKDFIKNVGLLYTLTDGFKDLSRLVKPSAKKEVKEKLKELENTLKTTGRSSGQSKFVGSKSTNEKSFWEKGFVLDIK